MTLSEALERWRAERDVVLAEQIDVLSQAVAPLPLPAAKRLHRWWMEHAKTYDPEVVTTLLAQLRAHANDEQRFGERIRAMLAWPDDPRVGVVLAEALAQRPFLDLHRMLRRRTLANPFVDSIVKRIVEIGDARALERVASLWNILGDDARKAITTVHLREPRYERPTIPSIEMAWSAVLAEPFSIQPRLVLADAYLQAGDVRGDVITTQCAPLLAIEEARARGETFDASGLFGVRADQVQKLLDANWHRWLGDVAMLVDRSARFRGGLLSDVRLGHAATPTGSWVIDRAARSRELCAVEHVRSSDWIRPARFVRFLAAMPHVPRWIHVDDPIAAELRKTPVRARCVSIYAPRSQPSRRFTQIVEDLVEGIPTIERIAFEYVGAYQLAEVHAIAGRFAVPLQFAVDWRPTVEERALIEELRALPHVRVFTYGDP